MKYLETYAELVLQTGISLRPKQNLYIRTGPDTYHFAALIAELAYARGAGYVYVDLLDNRLLSRRLQLQDTEAITHMPAFLRSLHDELLSHDWAYIRIHNTEDEHFLEASDPGKLKEYNRSIRQQLQTFYSSLMRDEHPWCVVTCPGDTWAKSVLGGSADAEQLWEVLIPILKLDHDDPPAAWQAFSRELQDRSAMLAETEIEILHFEGPGTDLKIGISEEAMWIGGTALLPDGREFMPNIPTEELFTTPDFRQVSGYVTCSKPFSLFGKQIGNVRLEYCEGELISYTAASAEDTELLSQYFSIDEGASRLGEVALVDQNSAIAASNLLFHNTLFDENAACHVALGAGYPACIPALNGADTDTLLQHGCNVSVVHTDMMIGSDDLQVTARCRDGSTRAVMRDGRFCLPSVP